MEQLEDRRLLAVNIVPKAIPDSASTVGNVPVLIDLVANDYDRDGAIDRASILITSGPNAGTVDVRIDGQVKYTPPYNRLGVDSFAYMVADDGGAISNPASVSVLVRSAYQNPDDHHDVNDDGARTPLDVLQVIAELNAGGSRFLPHPPPRSMAPPPYVDVTGDGWLTPADAKRTIECLNGIFDGRDSLACRYEPPPPFPSSGSTDPTLPDTIPPDVIDPSEPSVPDPSLPTEPPDQSDELPPETDPIPTEPPDHSEELPPEIDPPAPLDDSSFPGLDTLAAGYSGTKLDDGGLEHPLLPGGISDLENLG
jgi:hypothetical protein